MMRKLTALLCAATLVLPVAAQAKTMEFTMGSTNLYISDGAIEAKTIETAPYTENDRTMVPVRIISENFGANVEWVEESRSVIIEDGANKIVLTLDSNEADVNGEIKHLDVAAREIGGRTMVPLRFISENLGKDVSYIAATEQVLISDEAPVMTVDDYAYTLDDYKFLMFFMGYSPEAYGNGVAFVQNATAVFKEFASIAEAARADGVQLSAESGQMIALGLQEEAGLIYANTLMAPGARILSDRYLANEYMEKKGMEFLLAQDVQSRYENEFICAKHILIMADETASKEEKAAAKITAEQVLKKIKKGEDFDALLAEYTEDPGMAQSPEGYVFTTGEMVKSFETAAFALEVGEVSDIVESDYGYHIIKREPLPAYEDYNEDAILESLYTAEGNRMYTEILANTQITMHMTAEEIAAALGI